MADLGPCGAASGEAGRGPRAVEDTQKRWEQARNRYIIGADGTYVGDYEGLYQSCEDPWFQDSTANSPLKQVILQKIAALPIRRVIDVGCGLGAFTDLIRSQAEAEVLGMDVSRTAVERARARYPECRFEVASATDLTKFADVKPTAICMLSLAWYMLDRFREVLGILKSHFRDAVLFHTLTFYGPGEQKYGREYFTGIEELLPYFSGMTVEETFVHRTYPNDGSYNSLVIARI